MASFKMNFARIDNCPPPKTLAGALEEYGMPEDEEWAVLNQSATDQVVFATLVRKTEQAIQRLDPETADVATTTVEKVTVFPIEIFPGRGIVEIYDAPASGVDQVAIFLAGGLALPTVMTGIDLDIVSAIGKLREGTEKFQLKSIRISEYAHDSYTCGPYAPKFLDSEHGVDFMQQYADFVISAGVRFQTFGARATVTLAPKANFRYSLTNEDDKPAVQSILRKLI